jgi:hypothetical protein
MKLCYRVAPKGQCTLSRKTFVVKVVSLCPLSIRSRLEIALLKS